MQIRSSHDTGTPGTTPSLSGAETPNGTQESSVKDAKNSTELQSLSDSEDIPDDDLEPYEVLRRYLQLKTRLHGRRPDLTLPNLRAAKALRFKPKVATTVDDSIDSATRRLLNRLKKIESDILFDQEEAEEQWVALRISILKEAATRKKLGLVDEHSSKPKIVKGARNPAAGQSESVHGITATETEDSLISLEDLFIGLPEYKVDDASGLSGIVSTGLDGRPVAVRDFGKWSGISPRRVLEEACKARWVLIMVHYKIDTNLPK